jgi:hypothetical protein
MAFLTVSAFNVLGRASKPRHRFGRAALHRHCIRCVALL